MFDTLGLHESISLSFQDEAMESSFSTEEPKDATDTLIPAL